MKNEFEKAMHITSELLSYCHMRGGSDFHLDISVAQNNASQFNIKATPVRISDGELAQLKKRLDVARQPGVEQEFWGLSGESETSSEIGLVGMMVDKAIVEYDVTKFILSITLIRKNL